MMKVVSIYPGHNGTVGYFENGNCHRILHEEKFTNIKNHLGFPFKSLEYLHQRYDLNTIDYVVIPAKTVLPWYVAPSGEATGSSYARGNVFENLTRNKARDLYGYWEYRLKWKEVFFRGKKLIVDHFITPPAKAATLAYLKKTYQIDHRHILFFDHHLCHALTPVYFYEIAPKYPNKEMLLLTLDGHGDYSCSKVFIYYPDKRTYRELVNIRFDASLGLLYATVTEFLGMKRLEHEYKVMGLAAYVTDFTHYEHLYQKLKQILWVNEDTLMFDSRFAISESVHFLKRHFYGERFDNIAAAIQRFTEDLTITWIKAVIKKTDIHSIACSGGVFMNVKMNQKILECGVVEKAYFQPSCSDESLVIGAAAKIFLDEYVSLTPIRTMYLGHRYTSKEIEKFFNQKGYSDKYTITYFDDIDKEIAQLLAEFKIVARFKGTGEWGARSLCNRSILGNASELKTFYEVNDAIKKRDFWMPFAPTILEEWAYKYILDWENIQMKCYDSTKYMIITFYSTELAQKHLKAAIHQKDKTLRAQIVCKEDNPEVYKLLKYYEDLTGMGGVLNTSLNIHGYPLVGSLEQALFTLENSGLQYMAIENYMIKR